MLLEEFNSALMSDLSKSGVVSFQVGVISERMFGALISMKLERLSSRFQRLLEFILSLGIGEAFQIVFGAEMELKWRFKMGYVA